MARPSERRFMSDNWLSSGKVENAKRGILAALGIGGAVATVLVFSVLFFTEIHFSVHSILSLSLHFALLFFSSYVMYFSLFETGRDKGETDEGAKAAHERCEALLARYEKEGDTASLRAFCEAATLKERREARASLLSRFLMTEEEGDALLARERGLSFTERRRRHALLSADAIRVTPAMLLSHRRSGQYRAPLSRSPERMRLRRSLSFLLFSAVTAAFSVSVVFDVLLSPTAGTLAAYLLKLFTLFCSGLRGFKAGFLHATADVTDYEREQADLLEEYLKEKTLFK